MHKAQQLILARSTRRRQRKRFPPSRLIRYILALPHWRQGLTREAMVPFIDYSIEKLDTHRIEATIEPGNMDTLRLAERWGSGGRANSCGIAYMSPANTLFWHKSGDLSFAVCMRVKAQQRRRCGGYERQKMALQSQCLS
jgi:Acetyltransferase (GNAT) domain